MKEVSRPVDLDAYFERIGWGGPTRPDYKTLARLLDAHMMRIPFESLDVLLGRPVRLELEPLQRKPGTNSRRQVHPGPGPWRARTASPRSAGRRRSGARRPRGPLDDPRRIGPN